MGFWDNVTGNVGLNLGGLGAGIFNYYAQKETNKANRELAELSYQQNVEQWERENAYNHPAEQMKRLTEAGLNPNLVYGSGSAVQTSAHSPQMSYPQMQAPKLDIGTQGISSTYSPLASSQISVNEAVEEYNKAKTVEAWSQANFLDSQTKKNIVDLVTLGARNQAILEELQSRISVNESLVDLNNSQIEVNTSIRDLNVEQKNLVLDKIKLLGCEIKQAEKLYEHWYSKGLTPAQGFEQLFAQATVLGIDFLKDNNFKDNPYIPDRYKGNGTDGTDGTDGAVVFNPFSKEWWSQYMFNLDRRPDNGYSMGDWR